MAILINDSVSFSYNVEAYFEKNIFRIILMHMKFFIFKKATGWDSLDT